MRTQYTHGRGTHGKDTKKNPMSKAFMGAFPDYTPEQAAQAKMERVYGKGFELPYDDDGQASEADLKKNLTGSQMKIAKQAAPFDSITGADFAAMKNAKENGMGSYRTKMAEYGRKMAMQGMRLMKEYANGTGDPKKPMTDSEVNRQEMMQQRQADRGMGIGERERMAMRDYQEETQYKPPTGADYKGALYKMPAIKEIVRGGDYENVDMERLAATLNRGSLPANLRGMIAQFIEEGPGAQQQVNEPAPRAVTQTPTQFSFQEGPRGEGGSLSIRGRQSDVKKRTMGGGMYMR